MLVAGSASRRPTLAELGENSRLHPTPGPRETRAADWTAFPATSLPSAAPVPRRAARRARGGPAPAAVVASARTESPSAAGVVRTGWTVDLPATSSACSPRTAPNLLAARVPIILREGGAGEDVAEVADGGRPTEAAVPAPDIASPAASVTVEVVRPPLHVEVAAAAADSHAYVRASALAQDASGAWVFAKYTLDSRTPGSELVLTPMSNPPPVETVQPGDTFEDASAAIAESLADGLSGRY